MIWRILPAVLFLLVGCGESKTPGDSGSLKVYRHSMDNAPGSLDPAQASTIYANFLVVNLYDTLYRYRYLERPYKIAPNLALGLPDISGDGLVYTIRIKKGVHFTDDPAFPDARGRELTAHDFVYSIKRHFDPATLSQGAWLWQGRITGLNDWKEKGSDYGQEIEGLRALDDHTIQIRLLEPFPQLIHTLTGGFSAVVAREAVEKYGREMSNHPVGSGPYSLLSMNSSQAILEPNPAFRQEPFDLEVEGYDASTQGHLGLETLQGRSPPFVDRLYVNFIAEEAARWNAFSSGDIDFLKVPVSQFDGVLAGINPVKARADILDAYQFQSWLESGFVFTNFNMDDERFGYHEDSVRNERNHALRCAIIKGFDWQRRNDIFYYGIGKVFPGIIPPVTAEADPLADRASIERDLEGASRLLQDNGWNQENLPILEYGYPASVTERQMFEQFRSFMMDIGYPPEKVQPLTYATFGDFFRAQSNREVMIMTSSWTMDYPDTENTMQLFYGPNRSPGSNTSNYNNEQFNRLYRASAVMLPSQERTDIYREMNQLLIDDCVAISGIARNLIFLWSKNTVMLPDRSFLGGYFLRFVDVDEPVP